MKLKKRATRVTFLTVATLTACIYFPLVASAALSDKQVISIIKTFPLEQQNMFSSGLRFLGWSLCQGLAWLVDSLQGIVEDVNSIMGNFFTSSQATAFVNRILPIGIALLAIMIVYVGVTMIVKPQQGTTVVGNFVIGVVVAIALPYFMTQAYILTNSGIKYVMSTDSGSQETFGNSILAENITDTTRYDAEGFSSVKLQYKNFMVASGNYKQVKNIDPGEVVKPDKMDYPEVWKNGYVTNDNGNEELKEHSTGDLLFWSNPLLSSYYYRWNIDFFNIIVTLLITSFALLFSGIRVARLLFELIFHQMLAQIMGLVDVITGQRLKKCLETIVATFVTLFACFLLLQLYITATAYVAKLQLSNPFVYLVIMFALAWGVIDGPDLFQQIFGIDAGIKSGFQSLVGAHSAYHLAKDVGQGTKATVLGKKDMAGNRQGGIRGKVVGNKQVDGTRKGGVVGATIGNKNADGTRKGGIVGATVGNKQADGTRKAGVVGATVGNKNADGLRTGGAVGFLFGDEVEKGNREKSSSKSSPSAAHDPNIAVASGAEHAASAKPPAAASAPPDSTKNTKTASTAQSKSPTTGNRKYNTSAPITGASGSTPAETPIPASDKSAKVSEPGYSSAAISDQGADSSPAVSAIGHAPEAAPAPAVSISPAAPATGHAPEAAPAPAMSIPPAAPATGHAPAAAPAPAMSIPPAAPATGYAPAAAPAPAMSIPPAAPATGYAPAAAPVPTVSIPSAAPTTGHAPAVAPAQGANIPSAAPATGHAPAAAPRPAVSIPSAPPATGHTPAAAPVQGASIPLAALIPAVSIPMTIPDTIVPSKQSLQPEAPINASQSDYETVSDITGNSTASPTQGVPAAPQAIITNDKPKAWRGQQKSAGSYAATKAPKTNKKKKEKE